MTHIVVAFDESYQSTAALEHTLELYPDATITAVHVTDPHEWVAPSGGIDTTHPEESLEQHRESTRAVLEQAEEIAATFDRDIQTEAVTGKPADKIVEYAETHGADHIVVGSHGRTGLERFLIGSVAERIVRRSPVPVTVMRERPEE